MRWHTADFDRLTWHDVHVHGFRVVENGNGTAELQLDIDFVLERLAPAGGPVRFRVAQAMLQFHEVFGLRFALDYVACSAGMSAFAIGGIARAPLRADEDDRGEREDVGPWRWRIDVDWPEGFLEFEATGFSQWLVGEEIELEVPSLAPADRL